MQAPCCIHEQDIHMRFLRLRQRSFGDINRLLFII
jgi:hypothetical protein